MGDIAEERELEGLKKSMDDLAIHLEELDVDIDSDVVSGVLRSLLAGHTSERIINEYGLHYEDGV